MDPVLKTYLQLLMKNGNKEGPILWVIMALNMITCLLRDSTFVCPAGKKGPIRLLKRAVKAIMDSCFSKGRNVVEGLRYLPVSL